MDPSCTSPEVPQRVVLCLFAQAGAGAVVSARWEHQAEPQAPASPGPVPSPQVHPGWVVAAGSSAWQLLPAPIDPTGSRPAPRLALAPVACGRGAVSLLGAGSAANLPRRSSSSPG